MSSGYDSLKKLSLTFNGYTFYMMSDIITHIYDYSDEQACIALYVNMVKNAHLIAKINSKHNQFHAFIDCGAFILGLYICVFCMLFQNNHP